MMVVQENFVFWTLMPTLNDCTFFSSFFFTYQPLLNAEYFSQVIGT